MNYRKNYFSVLVYEGVAIICNLLLPAIIIKTFGDTANGLLTSISQFLSFIALLEGGIGAVVLSELYKPIEQKNSQQLRMLLSTASGFFRKLACWFIIYTVLLAVIYPVFINHTFGFKYTAFLVGILSISTIGEYLFAITNRLLLQGLQKVYVVNFTISVTRILNLIITAVLANVYPDLHFIKLASCGIFFLQPIFFYLVIGKNYRIRNSHCKEDTSAFLKNRWSGFAQNLAHFVNMNTDIVLITLFLGLSNVSVYSVYMLGVNALRAIVSNLVSSRQSVMGKFYASGDLQKLNAAFLKVERETWLIGTVLFCTCLLLINPFVALYTRDITQIDYQQPLFALLIVIAYWLYSIREPYRLLVLAAGKFKETNTGSVLEAVINLCLSLALVPFFGLAGVAIGTLCAMIYRFIYFLCFLKKDIIFRSFHAYIMPFLRLTLILTVNIFALNLIKIELNSYLSFICYGIIIVAAEFLAYLAAGAVIHVVSSLVSSAIKYKSSGNQDK